MSAYDDQCDFCLRKTWELGVRRAVASSASMAMICDSCAAIVNEIIRDGLNAEYEKLKDFAP